ncbi:ISAs1 family transposase [Planomonospora parontospora]|uniref:ISAs1 family transposase n=1 Tax=Planomonospora parontospora TaxID=58119 RepID=UPI0036141536
MTGATCAQALITRSWAGTVAEIGRVPFHGIRTAGDDRVPPHEATLRRAFAHLDADALDAAVAAWLNRPARTPATPPDDRPRRRAVAVDSKSLRGTRTADGEAVHPLSAVDQSGGLVLAQTGVGGKTNEITRFRPLLQGLDLAGCVITADALHTQRDHVDFLVGEKRPLHRDREAEPAEPVCAGQNTAVAQGARRRPAA